MKKFLYSNCTKAAAAALFVLITVISAYISVCCYKELEKNEFIVFENGDYALKKPIREAAKGVYEYFKNENESSAAAMRNILRRHDGEIYSRVVSGDTVLYADTEDVEVFKNAEIRYIAEGSGENLYYDVPDNMPQYEYENLNGKIYLALRPEYISAQRARQAEAKRMLSDYTLNITLLLSAALLLLIYLCAATGRRAEDGGIHLTAFDRIYTEFICALAAAAAAGEIIVAAAAVSATEIDVTAAAAAGTAVCSGVFLISLLAAVKNIKNKSFVKNGIIGGLIIKLLKFLKKYVNDINKIISQRLRAVPVVLLMAYTAATVICGALINESAAAAVGCIVLFLAGSLFLGIRASDFDEVRKSAEEIRGGNTEYMHGRIYCADYKRLAETIDDVAQGFSESVEKRIKAEHMKTELVTNVSHDLKTPLTSIINYTKLLEKINLSPEEANDYVKIISSKSERLKNLTADLFDIAKVRSGIEDIEKEKLSAALLINQSLGEYDGEIKKSGLTVCMNAEENLYISADGKKMSRVMGNLISNFIKYGLKGTRVFITAKRSGETAVIEFKNTSAYPIDFDAEEITERFVRGDKSRSQEGNGLGLAIAKGYTQACGGEFIIKTDGDLFKAIMIFDCME